MRIIVRRKGAEDAEVMRGLGIGDWIYAVISTQ
jgi:hypothetical protein